MELLKRKRDKALNIFILVLLTVLSVLSCSSESQPFCFVQITDPQLGFNSGPEEETVGWLSKTIDRIIEINPDFVICTGDMTHDMFNNEWQINAYDSLMGKMPASIPVWYVPGNHDYRTQEWPGSREFYAEHFGDDRFCFMHKGSLFIGFDSNIIKEGLETQEAEQFDWLVEQLDKCGKKADHIFVFQHCPVVSTSVDEPDSYSNFPEPYRTKYLDLFNKYGVEAVFSGHCHRSAEIKVGDVSLVDCGACGIPLGATNSDGTPNIHCINIVDVTPDEASWSFRPVFE